MLSFGRPELARRAVESLRSSERAPDEIVVVDNDPANSFEGELAALGQPLTYLPNRANLGFPAAMNRGLRHALDGDAELLLVANNDAEIPSDTLGKLERALAAHPAAGVAGPVLLTRSEPPLVSSAGFAFSARSGRAKQVGSGRALAEVAPPAWSEPTAVSGGLLLLRRELLLRAGLFDEEFFLSFEDLELCLRARRLGFTVGLAGDAFARHEGGGSLSTRSPGRIYFATRNHLLAAERGAPLSSAAARAVRTASIVALNLGYALQSGEGRLGARVGAVAAGWRDFRRGRLGAQGRAPEPPAGPAQ